jgi:hypothetical protein
MKKASLNVHKVDFTKKIDQYSKSKIKKAL